LQADENHCRYYGDKADDLKDFFDNRPEARGWGLLAVNAVLSVAAILWIGWTRRTPSLVWRLAGVVVVLSVYSVVACHSMILITGVK
jgi:hypothetical protein